MKKAKLKISPVSSFIDDQPFQSAQAQISSGTSATGVKGAENWPQLQVDEQESQKYFDSLPSMVCCTKDLAQMSQLSAPLELSNGVVITPGERAALYFYTQSGFSFVNNTLSGNTAALQRAFSEHGIDLEKHGEDISAEIQTHIRIVCSAINKLPPSASLDKYRGGLLSQSDADALWAALQSKSPIVERQILSTSADMVVAKEFLQTKRERTLARQIRKINAAVATGEPAPEIPRMIPVLFAIRGANGKEITDYSGAKGEVEIVYVPGTKWAVRGILGKDKVPPEHRNAYSFVVLLEEVAPSDTQPHQ